MPDKKDKPCPGKCRMLHFIRRIDDNTDEYRCDKCGAIVRMSGASPVQERTKEEGE